MVTGNPEVLRARSPVRGNGTPLAGLIPGLFEPVSREVDTLDTPVFLRDWRSTGIMSRMRLALSEFNCRLTITMTIVFFLDSGICFAHQNASKRPGPEPTLKCQTDGVRLEGKLADRTFNGPPGLGKDTHERA